MGVGSNPLSVPFVLLAFQNGFFWKSVMSRLLGQQEAKVRKVLAVALPLAFVVGLAAPLFFVREESSWQATAAQACGASLFEFPQDPLPPQLRDLLGPRAQQRSEETVETLRVALNELPGEFLADVNVSLNCVPSSYDASGVNVYFVARDPQQKFSQAKGRITTWTDANHVLVFGQDFWLFFEEAWRPILAWRGEVNDADFLEAFGDYVAELYQFYLEWSIAHELGHMKLGHRFTGHCQVAGLHPKPVPIT